MTKAQHAEVIPFPKQKRPPLTKGQADCFNILMPFRQHGSFDSDAEHIAAAIRLDAEIQKARAQLKN